MNSRSQSIFAELLGTASLSAVVIGSGIMADKLANGNTAIALIANTGATAAALTVLIRLFADVSGSHFNPLVSLSELFERRLSASQGIAYIVAQIAGAISGGLLAHAMFDLPIIQVSEKIRATPGALLSEIIATAGLFLVIRRSERVSAPVNIALYIAAAYWFTASTSFANPAITIGRIFTNTFAGISPSSAMAFIPAQFVGATLGLLLARLLSPNTPSQTPQS